jgi:hypothetical protein
MIHLMTTLTRKAGFFAAGLMLCLLGSIGASKVQAEPLLRVVDMAWTDGITESKSPMTIYKTGAAPADKPLYLWIQVRGEKKAYEKLKEKGRITIIHKWSYNYLGWNTERIDVSIGRDQKLDDETLKKLEQELDTYGRFDWRTWSQKNNFVTDVYSVTVVDGFDDMLGCDISDSCEMNIRLVK